MVGLHLLSQEDALLRIQEIYVNPWRSIQTGLIGLLFILVGLAFAKMLIKRSRQSEAVIFHGEMGPIVVAITAIEDVVKKVLKRFALVKEWKTKTLVDGRNVEIRLRLALWSGGDIPGLLNSVQQEIRSRLQKILGQECTIEVYCDVARIEESQLDMEQGIIAI